MHIEHCFMGDQWFLRVISTFLICTHRYIGKFMTSPIKNYLPHQYTKWSESKILCSLILSKMLAESVLVFTVAVEKSFCECPWPRNNHCCCLWEEQLRQITTWLVLCHGMTTPPKICQALPSRNMSAMLLSSGGNLASGYSKPLNIMNRIEMNCLK